MFYMFKSGCYCCPPAKCYPRAKLTVLIGWLTYSAVCPGQDMQSAKERRQRRSLQLQTSVWHWTAAKAPSCPMSWMKAPSWTWTASTRRQTTATSSSGKVRSVYHYSLAVTEFLKTRFSNEFLRAEMQHLLLSENTAHCCPGLICIYSRVSMVLWWRPSPSTVVKICLIVLCFHTAAFLFFWEEMFPLSVWKQAASQLQVSLSLAVRSPGLHIYYLVFFSCRAHVNQSDFGSVISFHRQIVQNSFSSFAIIIFIMM